MKNLLKTFIFIVLLSGCKKTIVTSQCTSCATDGTVRFVPVGNYHYKVQVGSETYYNYLRRSSHPIDPSDCTTSCPDCGDINQSPGTYTYYVYRDRASSVTPDTLVQTGSVSVSTGSCRVIRCTE